MTVLVIAEHDNQKLNAATLPVITAAAELSNDIVVLVAGYHCKNVAEEVAKIQGVQGVLLADDSVYAHSLAENLADLMITIAADYSHILAPSTAFGKNFLPRVAALLNVAQISDVIRILSEDTFIRPIYAGNALTTVKSSDKIKVLTVRLTAFLPAAKKELVSPIKTLDIIIENKKTQWISLEENPSERPELISARIVISGGRGLQSAENFQLLEKIADKIGAAIGASRAAVDAGYAPNDWQVGQTGKVIAPELYIAVGISGAIQHVAGMKDSKVIVAINKDPDAPIFQIADYGLVGDLFEILPQLEKALSYL